MSIMSCLLLWPLYQELMSLVFHGLGDFAVACLDDIIIFSTSEEGHKQHIQNFCLPQATQLKILSRGELMQKETQYLCFIISENSIMADPDKVKVRRQVLPP